MKGAQIQGERRMLFEAIRSHADVVRAYALRRADPDEAEDVVAVTFLVAWRRLDEVPEHARPWLLGVARRVLANRRRGADRLMSLTDRLTEREQRRPPDGANDEADLRLTLGPALDRLPKRSRRLNRTENVRPIPPSDPTSRASMVAGTIPNRSTAPSRTLCSSAVLTASDGAVSRSRCSAGR